VAPGNLASELPIIDLDLVAAVINKMVPPKDVQGRIYKFKSKSECLGLGIPIPVVPDIVRGHMILVLGVVPGKMDYVKIITVSV
jgi:hypothetical protein